MKKLIEITGIIMAVAMVVVMIYQLVNTIPPEGSSQESMAIAIFKDASCMACHSRNTLAPFSTNIPLIGQWTKKNRQRGWLRFDMNEAWSRLQKGEAINETHLAKIEMETVVRNTMPPVSHYLVHWGASVTTPKQTMLKNWITHHREKFYPSPLAADSFKQEPVRPIPTPEPVDKRKVALGKKLFYDKRISSDHSISCATCHHPETGGANNRQFVEGVNKRLTHVNTLTLYNASFNRLLSWNGSAKSLETHIEQHVTHPAILGYASINELIQRLQKEADLLPLFEKTYPKEGLTKTTLTNALTHYGKTLLTPDCNFDKYLKGDVYAISQKEVFGYILFKSHRCITCHTGINLGGQTHERIGIYKDYFDDRGWELAPEDLGRFQYTGDEYDRYRFKVPGLRNVALTKPYFHDGSQQTLYDAVQTMGIYQTGQHINEEEINAMVAFLEALTGEQKY